jgi:hypothetical protein
MPFSYGSQLFQGIYYLFLMKLWGLWGLGIGDWGLGPIPNPQSPIPNPHNPHFYLLKNIIYR